MSNNSNDQMYDQNSGNPIPPQQSTQPYPPQNQDSTYEQNGITQSENPFSREYQANIPPNQDYNNQTYQNLDTPTQPSNDPYFQYQNYNNSTFDNQYSDNQYSDNPMYSNTNNPQPSPLALAPRKKLSKWLWGLTAIPVLLIIAIVCYLTVPSVKNFVYKNLLSTEKYYLHMEELNSKESLSNLEHWIQTFESISTAQEGNISFHIAPELSQEFTDIANILNNLTITFSNNTKDTTTLGTFSVMYNNSTSLLTVEIYLDSANAKYYLRIPELSDTYLEVDLTTAASLTYFGDTIAENLNANLEELDSDQILKLLEKYSTLLYQAMAKEGTIEKDNNATATVSGVTQSCTSFLVSINEKQLANVVISVLNKAKGDSELQKIAQIFGVNASMYETSIQSMITEFQNNSSQFSDDSWLRMTVYTDDTHVIGRTISLIDDNTNSGFSYLVVEDNNTLHGELKFYDFLEETVSVTLQAKSSESGYTGDVTFTTNEESFVLNFKDVSLVNDKNSFGLINGTFSFTEPTTMQSISLKATATSESQELSLSYSLLSIEAFSLTLTTKKVDAKDVVLPSIDQVIKLEDTTALQNYILTSNYEEVFTNIATTLGYSPEEIATMLSGLDGSLPSTELPGTDDTESDPTTSTLNPQDYNLPEGTEIDSYGYYTYDLQDSDLKPGVAGTGYYLFDLTESTMRPIIESCLDLFSNLQFEEERITDNYVRGNINDGYQYQYQYLTQYYYGSDYDTVISVDYDSVTEQLISLSLSGSDIEALKAATTLICSTIQGTTLSTTDTTEIEKAFNTADYTFVNIGTLELYVSSNNSNTYFISIEKTN